ncbi:PstS family phosphate ABC transporter substrate-binding protein [Mesoterricola sediminis]|uniref:Phosphate ABC transporter substrate-binding protein n=1 Tax=Mesoterricola sediminis TaxID=2927980 RepID=A0AA48KH55_9BACT|nr:substrate-binding domain-containing protein [Mesoterricola sediminis]BDU78053.1 phosphate ABC transporter substrate-binding protein [Mesoterricola sediminis]
MGLSILRIAAILALAALPQAAQTAQMRAKVSEALPHYNPTVAVNGAVEIPGTDAISDLGEEWGRLFHQYQPQGRIVYVPKLTKEAVKDLTEGTRPLVITARELSQDEMKAFQAKHGYMPMRIPVCLDAIIVFVHKNNPISSISMEQLDAIFGQERHGGYKEPAATWSDFRVRGDLGKRAIVAYGRGEGTTTREAFQASVLLNGPFKAGVIAKPDASSLAESVITDEAGIAFGSLASWYAGVKVLPVIPYKSSDARLPNQDNVTLSRYPMPRLYYAYLNRAPGAALDPALGEVLHFLLSQEGQGVAADVGLLPAPHEFLTIALKRLER